METLLNTFLIDLETYLASGGILVIPLGFVCLVLWYIIGYRYSLFKNFERQNYDFGDLSNVDIMLFDLKVASKKYSRILTHLVICAPLLGLLGTVIGMIETFESMSDMELFSQDGGIAAGISQALITTQIGLGIAIPGQVFGRILKKKEIKIIYQVEQLEMQFQRELQQG